MFFKFIRVIARTILAVVNGNAHYQNQDKLPEGNYILVAPHRTWWDPVYMALGASSCSRIRFCDSFWCI